MSAPSKWEDLPLIQQNHIKAKAEAAGLTPEKYFEKHVIYQKQAPPPPKEAPPPKLSEPKEILAAMYKYYKKIDVKNNDIILSTVNNQASQFNGKYSILSIVNDVVTVENEILTKFNSLYGENGTKAIGRLVIGYDKYKRYQTKIMIAIGNSIIRKACIKAGGNAVIGLSYHFAPIFQNNISLNKIKCVNELIVTGTCIKIDGYKSKSDKNKNDTNLDPSAPPPPDYNDDSTLPSYDDIQFGVEGKTDQ